MGRLSRIRVQLKHSHCRENDFAEGKKRFQLCFVASSRAKLISPAAACCRTAEAILRQPRRGGPACPPSVPVSSRHRIEMGEARAAVIRARLARLKMSEPLADVRIRPVAAAVDVLLLRRADEQSEHIAGATSCVGLANHLWRLFRHESDLRDCRRSFVAQRHMMRSSHNTSIQNISG